MLSQWVTDRHENSTEAEILHPKQYMLLVQTNWLIWWPFAGLKA